MSMNLVTLLYLVASVFFIQALKGLSHPTTSLRGNLFGMVGMAIAVLTTGALIVELSGGKFAAMGYVLAALVVGGAAGTLMAKRVEMTKMPELVAFMHSMIGLAAVFIAVAAVAEPYAFNIAAKGEPIPFGNRLELFLGAAIGAITFSGSVIAFGKLSGKYKFRLFQGAPVTFAGQHMLNLALGLIMLGLGLVFSFTGNWNAFFAMLALAFVMGVLIIIPIGGADMPVVVSMLNSYSGWAAAGIGFSLNNSMLIIAGSLVGSSGAILSYIMCKAMNRSFFNVILGGVLVPATAMALPLFLLFSKVQLTNTYWAVLLPSIVSPFGVYLTRIFAASSVPDEVLEAARLDGSGEIRTFFTVSIRLMSPALVTVFLFQFVAIWNNYMLPSIMLGNDQLFPITVGLSGLLNQGASQPAMYTYVITGALLSIIPLIALFLTLQRYWQVDLAAGAVKA